MSQRRWMPYAVFFATALIAAAVDLHSKDIAFQKLASGGRIQVVDGWLEYQYTTNPGVIFGLGRDWSAVFFWISLAAMPVITVVFLRMKKRTFTLTTALAFILGGTIGNAWDRLFHGKQVRDFIHFYRFEWPIFNLADSFILIGTILLMLELVLFEEKKKADDAPAPTQPGPT